MHQNIKTELEKQNKTVKGTNGFLGRHDKLQRLARIKTVCADKWVFMVSATKC